MQARADIGRFDKAVIDAEDQDQRHLGDEQQTEKEGEPLDRLLAARFERVVIELIDDHPDHEKHRQHQHPGQDRIEPGRSVDDIRRIGAEQDKGRLRDIGDVEHAEGDRDPDRHRGVKPAQQDAGDDRVDQQVERNRHGVPGSAPAARRPGSARRRFGGARSKATCCSPLRLSRHDAERALMRRPH